MKNVRVGRFMLVAVVLALFGCAQPRDAVVIPSSLTATQTTVESPVMHGIFVAESCESSSPCSPASGLVSRLHGRDITDGVSNPVEMAVDNAGNLYVSNAVTVDQGNVTVYAAGSGRLLRTLTGYKGDSYALAFSPAGDLYLVSHHKEGCCQIRGSVAVYKAGETRPFRWLSDVGSFPGKPAFDASGNFYQPNFYNFPGFINVYAPGAGTPFRQIIQGIGFPLALTFDKFGHLYVLNGVFAGGTDVLVYARNADSPTLTIQTGVSNASAIALDSNGALYVANRGEAGVSASVTVFASGTSTPEHTIRTGIHDPSALALDEKGNLYVANAPAKGTNTVTVYEPGALTPKKTFDLDEAPTALWIP